VERRSRLRVLVVTLSYLGELHLRQLTVFDTPPLSCHLSSRLDGVQSQVLIKVVRVVLLWAIRVRALILSPFFLLKYRDILSNNLAIWDFIELVYKKVAVIAVLLGREFHHLFLQIKIKSLISRHSLILQDVSVVFVGVHYLRIQYFLEPLVIYRVNEAELLQWLCVCWDIFGVLARESFILVPWEWRLIKLGKILLLIFRIGLVKGIVRIRVLVEFYLKDSRPQGRSFLIHVKVEGWVIIIDRALLLHLAGDSGLPLHAESDLSHVRRLL